MELAKNYHLPYLLKSTGSVCRNPILEKILPSLLYLRMVSLFDEGLLRYIKNNELSMPKEKYKNNLNGHIEFLNDNGLIKNTKKCHQIRKRRNDIAHESNTGISWTDLDNDFRIFESELKNLDLIGERPSYEIYAEQSAVRGSTEKNVLTEQDFCFGLKEGDKKRIEISYTEKLMRDEH